MDSVPPRVGNPLRYPLLAVVNGADHGEGGGRRRPARDGLCAAHGHVAPALSAIPGRLDPGEPCDLRVAHVEAVRAP
eukprot:13812368-Heterocapsa_arctica.AAC.1